VSNRLANLVGDRLTSPTTTPTGAGAGEPLGVTILEELSSAVAVETLERKGLARIYEDDRRLEASLAHPLYGEVVRTRLGRMRSRNVLRALADAIEAHGAQRRGDVRIATGARVRQRHRPRHARRRAKVHRHRLPTAGGSGRAAWSRTGGHLSTCSPSWASVTSRDRCYRTTDLAVTDASGRSSP
jgi:hypothetical protein